MKLQSRFLLIALSGMLTIPATSALASSYRHINEYGEAIITQQPPAKRPYAVIDDAGRQLWYVSNKSVPMSHWRPFWAAPSPSVGELGPFDVQESQGRRPIVTIEELGPEDRNRRP